MKKIELKDNDAAILKVIFENSFEGISIGDVRNSVKMLDRIEANTGVLLLEDADYAYLQKRFNATKFIKADRSLVDLADRIDNAKAPEE